jgi:hypothetical protein
MPARGARVVENGVYTAENIVRLVREVESVSNV